MKEELLKLRDFYRSQATDGLYWLGYFNGLEHVLSIIENRKPEYVLASEYMKEAKRRDDKAADME